MDLKEKVNILILGLVILFAAGCVGEEKKQQDPTPQIQDPIPQDTVNVSRGCAPVKYIDHLGNVWDYVYNSAGQITKITYSPSSGSQLTPYFQVIKYNSAGKIDKIITGDVYNNSLGGRRVYAYSPDGLLISESIYQNSTTSIISFQNDFEYDAAKRLVKIISWKSGMSMAYTYFPDGKIQENIYYGIIGVTKANLRESRLYEFNTGKAPWGKISFFNIPAYYMDAGHIDGILFNKLPHTVIYGPPNSQGMYINFNYSYTFNADGYPTEQVISYNGKYLGKSSWIYNCQ